MMVNHLQSPEIACKRIFDDDLSFYRSVIDNLKIPVFVVDSKGAFIYSNKAASFITGYSYDELLQMHFIDLFPTPGKEDPFNIPINNFECRTEFKHKENSNIPVTIKTYNFSQNEKRKFHYQIILKNFYFTPDEISELYLPMVSLAAQIKKVNDEFEATIRGITNNSSNTSTN